MTGRLAGKRAVVTGGRRGIGRAVVRRLQQEGAEVVVVHRPHAPGEVVERSGAYLAAEITDPDAMAAAMAQASGDGRIDICVANAGTYLEAHGFLGDAPEVWAELLRVNVLGVLVTFQAAARHMAADGQGGRLLATASLAGLRGEKECPAYSASKAAVVALVQSLAVALGPDGITVNAVAPGPVDTEMARDAMALVAASTGRTTDEVRAARTRTIPTGRVGDPAQVAALLAFLAADEAAHITGETVRIDGGEYLT